MGKNWYKVRSPEGYMAMKLIKQRERETEKC